MSVLEIYPHIALTIAIGTFVSEWLVSEFVK